MPYQVRVAQKVVFEAGSSGGAWNPYRDLFELPERALESLPEPLQFDSPPEVKNLMLPSYPYDLLASRTNGDAVVTFIVGADGRVAHSRLREATHPEFGYAAAAAIDMWEFTPATKNGSPSPALFTFRHDFKSSGEGDVPVRRDAQTLIRRLERDRASFATLDDLDAIPELKVRRAPTVPSALRDGFTGGEALIEFIIDKRGIVQVPRIVSSSQPELGYAAVAALTAWRYDPPRQDDRGTEVLVRQRIVFK